MGAGAGTRWIWRAIVLLCLGGALALVIAVLAFASALDKYGSGNPPAADGIVVLTGGADRISDALDLLERGKGKRLFITGVHTQSSVETLKRLWPAQAGLFDCCIDLDRQARNTYGNAKETKNWIRARGMSSLLLVTASYHMPRAMLEFEHALPGTRIIPHPVVPEASRLRRWWQDPALTRIILTEFAKYVGARARIFLGIAWG